jgi:hypothetical protein
MAASFRSIGWAGEGIMGKVRPGAGPHVDPRKPTGSRAECLCWTFPWSPTPLCVQGSGFRAYAILPMMVFMSSAENARSVSVRMFPCPPRLNASAVADISSAASLIVTMS